MTQPLCGGGAAGRQIHFKATFGKLEMGLAEFPRRWQKQTLHKFEGRAVDSVEAPLTNPASTIQLTGGE